MIYAIVIMILGVTAANQCNTICTSNYAKRNDLKPVGCDQTTMWTTDCKSELSCALTCASKNTCASFLYKSNPGTCSLCHGDQIQSLGFSTDEDFFWPLHFKEKLPLSDAVAKTTSEFVPINVTIGTVVHVEGYYYSLNGFNIDFWQDIEGKNISLHFRPRRTSETNYVPEIVLAYCENSVFRNQIAPVVMPYPFVENTVTTVDVLVTKDGYQIYIDQKFCCSYNHALPYGKTQYLVINGNIEVYELRF